MRWIVVFFLLSLPCAAQDSYKNIYSRFAWKERDKWQRADELIRLLNITQGSKVSDIGCHEGYMTFKLSRTVGDQGKVYAVDVDDSKLSKMRSAIADAGIKNIEVIKGDYDNPRLPENTLDAVIILDTYHEMVDHDEILQHVKAALKSGGRIVICEPIAENRRKLSRGDQERKHEIAIAFVIDDLKKTGFNITYQKDPFIDRTKEKGDKMWVIVATK